MATVSGFDLKHFDEMMQKFEKLKENAMSRGKKVVNVGAKIVLEQQKEDAPRRTGKSRDGLKISETKLYKTSVYAKVGLNSKNWEQSKSLWYHHFGYHNHLTGKFYGYHAGWMNTSFDKCKDRARKAMIAELEKTDLTLR